MPPAEDRISTLPDGILCHILSFLPTKHALVTIFLSKRWSNLWFSLPSLNFTETLIEDREAHFRFNEFVYSVLFSRDASQAIKTFLLDIECHNVDVGYIGYLNIVTQRRVEHLDLNVLSRIVMPKLTLSILCCKTLVVLNLRGFILSGFSSSVGLPSLKTLRLDCVVFGSYRCVMKLLAACPVLEDLQLSCITDQGEGSFPYREFQTLSLTNLTRADIFCFLYPFPLKALHHVESLRIEIDKVYRSYDAIPTFHNLTHVELNSLNYNWHLLVEVLKHCPKLQNLHLNEADTDGVLKQVQENWVDPEFVPECLSLHLRTCTLWNFVGLQGELLLARYILKTGRVLQTMTIWSREQLEIESALSLCPRASATCQLSVEVDNR